jgi:uncharacterized integral membrane protein
VKIGMVILFIILAVGHLTTREYPFGGPVQTGLDILLVIFGAVVVGTLLNTIISKKQREANPPREQEHNHQ